VLQEENTNDRLRGEGEDGMDRVVGAEVVVVVEEEIGIEMEIGVGSEIATVAEVVVVVGAEEGEEEEGAEDLPKTSMALQNSLPRVLTSKTRGLYLPLRLLSLM
jgi:acyl carrier protein